MTIVNHSEQGNSGYSALIDRASEFDIVVQDVALTEVHFGREFMAAVEAKQVAQQEAERAKFIVTQALEEKRSKIIKAEGEAKAAALISEKMKDPGYIELRRLEVPNEAPQSVESKTLLQQHTTLY